jgi:hypothetical protein
MKSSLIAGLLLTMITIGCGAGGGAKDTGGPLPDPARNPDDSPGDAGRDGFYIGILDLTGRNIPITMVPSITNDGKLVPVCKDGQTMHLDECFDEIHLSDQPGFRLSRAGTEVQEIGKMSESWVSSFSDIEKRGTSQTLRHRQTYECRDWCPEPPTAYGSYGSRGTVLAEELKGSLKLAENTTLFAFFSFGGTPGKPVHVWLSNGTITLNGTTLRLPVTRREIRALLPDFYDDRAKTTAGNVLSFKWEDETFGLKNLPTDKDDLHLISISFDEIGEEE